MRPKRVTGAKAGTGFRWQILPAACCLVLLAPAAHAQLLERYEPSGIPGFPDWFTDTVQPGATKQGETTGFEALSLKVGSFNIDPMLTEALGYDSNFLNSAHPVSSPTVESAASVHVGSDWTRNAIDASVTVDDVRYLDAASQSYTNWSASTGSRLDIGEDQANFAFSHATTYSLPTEVGSFGFSQPYRTSIEEGRASYQLQLGAFSITPGFDISSYTNSGGGPNDRVSFDNRIAYTGTLALGYALTDSTTLVLIGSDTQARFSETRPGTPNLNYGDASVLAGIDVHPDGVLRYRALVGYEQLDYATSGLAGVSAPAAELDAVWQPTALTTLTGRVTQSLQNSAGATTGTYTYTAVHGRIDHAYLRNLILDAVIDYQSADFTDSNEHQSVLTAGVGARWQVNRGLALAVNYSFQSLSATGEVNRDTTRHTATLQVTFRPGAFD